MNNAKKQCTYHILGVYTHARDFLPKQLWISNQKQGGDLEKHQVAAMSPVLRVINLLSYENINCAIHQQQYFLWDKFPSFTARSIPLASK